MLCGSGPLACGVPAMLFYAKVKKLGMISIMGIPVLPVACFVFGVLGQRLLHRHFEKAGIS